MEPKGFIFSFGLFLAAGIVFPALNDRAFTL